MKKVGSLLAFLLVFIMVVTACAPAATTLAGTTGQTDLQVTTTGTTYPITDTGNDHDCTTTDPMNTGTGVNGDGTLPEKYSMISMDCDNVILETVKESEDGNDLILRLYESKNMRKKLTLTLGFDAGAVELVNLMENPQAPLTLDGRKITLVVKPFEIVTLRIKK